MERQTGNPVTSVIGHGGNRPSADHSLFTQVYTQEVGVHHRFNEDSYDRLREAGVTWQTVQQVMRAHPAIRRHTGAVLQVAAPLKDWATGEETWVLVVLIEEQDDEYLVVSARQLHGVEAESARKMLEGGA